MVKYIQNMGMQESTFKMKQSTITFANFPVT